MRCVANPGRSRSIVIKEANIPALNINKFSGVTVKAKRQSARELLG